MYIILFIFVNPALVKGGDTLLHISARLGLEDACQALVECGAHVEAKDKVRLTLSL